MSSGIPDLRSGPNGPAEPHLRARSTGEQSASFCPPNGLCLERGETSTTSGRLNEAGSFKARPTCQLPMAYRGLGLEEGLLTKASGLLSNEVLQPGEQK